MSSLVRSSSLLAGLAGSLVVTLAACTDASPTTGSAAGELTQDQCDYFAVGGTVNVCHRTGSARKPYNVLRVAASACAGHAGHAGDYLTSLDPSSPLYDPTCNGQGCFPAGAPYDGSVECCDGLGPKDGVCAPLVVCGDGLLGGTEECDDGNVSAGDGCSATCTIEAPPVYVTVGDPTPLSEFGNVDANAATFAFDCPDHGIGVGLRGVALNWFGFPTLAQLSLVCATPTGEQLTTAVGIESNPLFDFQPFALACPAGSALAAYTMTWNAVGAHSVELTCRELAGSAVTTLGPVGYGDPADIGGPASVACPAGQVIDEIHGKFGSIVDSLGFGCRAVTLAP